MVSGDSLLGEAGRRSSAFPLRNLFQMPHESGRRPRFTVTPCSTLGLRSLSSLWSLPKGSALMSSGYLQKPIRLPVHSTVGRLPSVEWRR